MFWKRALKSNLFTLPRERQMQRTVNNIKKGREMKEKSILVITLICLSMFGLRSILPEISSAALEGLNTVYASFANSGLIASVVDTVALFVS
jgi:hypothetical protein